MKYFTFERFENTTCYVSLASKTFIWPLRMQNEEGKNVIKESEVESRRACSYDHTSRISINAFKSKNVSKHWAKLMNNL